VTLQTGLNGGVRIDLTNLVQDGGARFVQKTIPGYLERMTESNKKFLSKGLS